MGLRERKKERTKHVLGDVAWRLFADRGFEHVTVADIAREAEVAETTVYNYFPTKEDLFYSRLEGFGAQLVAAVTARETGESVLTAFRRFVLETNGLLTEIEAGDATALARARTAHRMIAESPALQAREQQALTRHTDALADALAGEAEPSGDHDTALEARVVANALMGVHRTLVDFTRRRILDDEQPTRLAADVHTLGSSAFALLERGLGDYGTRAEGP